MFCICLNLDSGGKCRSLFCIFILIHFNPKIPSICRAVRKYRGLTTGDLDLELALEVTSFTNHRVIFPHRRVFFALTIPTMGRGQVFWKRQLLPSLATLPNLRTCQLCEDNTQKNTMESAGISWRKNGLSLQDTMSANGFLLYSIQGFPHKILTH